MTIEQGIVLHITLLLLYVIWFGGVVYFFQARRSLVFYFCLTFWPLTLLGHYLWWKYQKNKKPETIK